jgi:hypothetical protein
LEETEISELSSEEMEEVCKTLESSAKKSVLSKLSPSKFSFLDITADIDGSKLIRANIDVELSLLLQFNVYDDQELARANKAVKNAFFAVDEYLKANKCKFKK